VRAGSVLSNADLKRTLLELVGPAHLPGGWVQKTNDMRMAAALFLTFLGVKGDVRDLGMTSSNVWQFDSYDMERFYRDEDGPFRSRGCYVTSASMKDPTSTHHAPPGISNVEVMTVVPSDLARWGVAAKDVAGWTYKDGEAYQAAKKRIEGEMVERFERLFPGAASRRP
jgi:all-trans-retinol 13,14-reductase